MWWRRPPQRTLLVRTDWWPELEQYTLWTYWVLPFCSSVRSPPHSTYSWTQSVRNNQTVRHTVKQRYLIRQTVRHSETVGHSHTQPDIVRHTQTVRHRETVGHSQIHSNTVRKTQHTKHTQKKENTRLWFDLLFPRWALAPQQPVAQYRTVGLTGLIPAHLDGGGRQSLGPEGLHPAGNLDCENTETQQVLDFLDY